MRLVTTEATIPTPASEYDIGLQAKIRKRAKCAVYRCTLPDHIRNAFVRRLTHIPDQLCRAVHGLGLGPQR
jgi:hypothetical protein